MAGNSFGEIFRITTFGESHGGGIGVVVDGCPAGLALDAADVQREVDRRKPGQSSITTPRKEADTIEILSGVFEGLTTGTPIAMLARNENVRSEDYGNIKDLFRPSHADFTYEAKYGRRNWAGSGRASARETLARVAAGAIAKKFLKEKLGVEFVSYVRQVGDIVADGDPLAARPEDIEANIVRCPDQAIAARMVALVEEVKADDDSIGGVVQGVIKNVPAGLGEPVFDRFAADLGKAMLSINATKGFEFGSGFAGVSMRGSQHNYEFYTEEGSVKTRTNHSGGTQGGITNGMPVVFRVAFKPVATIGKRQKTVNRAMESVELEAAGRHDPCVLPRAVPIVDAMAAIVTMDHYLRQLAQSAAR
jgi:chorismate synthase